jgi:hypothetical protein
MNHSFIVRSGSIIGRNLSDLSIRQQDISSLELSRRDKSVVSANKEDSYFHVGDPDVDPVKEIDVLRAIPQGRFQMLMFFFYFVLFITTSALCFNFAFFLMPHAYLCPVSQVVNPPVVAINQTMMGGESTVL